MKFPRIFKRQNKVVRTQVQEKVEEKKPQNNLSRIKIEQGEMLNFIQLINMSKIIYENLGMLQRDYDMQKEKLSIQSDDIAIEIRNTQNNLFVKYNIKKGRISDFDQNTNEMIVNMEAK